MPSAQAVEKLTANMAISHYDFDPNGVDPVDVAWVDMRDFGHLMASFFRTVGAGAIDTFRVIANSEPDGSGADVIIKTKTIAAQPNALGDYIFIEVTAEEIRSQGANLLYVSLQIEFAVATDEGVVTYIRDKPRFAHSGLSADTVA